MYSPYFSGEKFVCLWAYGGSGAVHSKEGENALLEAAKNENETQLPAVRVQLTQGKAN